MRKAFLLFLPVFSVALSVAAFAQGTRATQKIDDEFVHSQFGDQFTLVPEIAPVFGDLDGDGIEDVAIAARCKNPLLDQGEHKYTVMDPYYDFFGYGDPRLTTTFSEGDPRRRGLVVLVIDGTGTDGWHSPNPKAKYVIVNLPYRAISIRKMKLKKKTIEAIYVEEDSEMAGSSAVFFDGRKFRYVPMGGEMQ